MEIVVFTIKILCVFFVIIGCLPLMTAVFQYLLIGLHSFHSHYEQVSNFLPRVSIIVPAWNEGLVIGETIDRLMKLEYPNRCLRVYVVDDASTDETPDVVKAKEKQYPNQVFHIRREKGGEGKAHTLNHGIKQILAEDWSEALMIIDADVLFEPSSLRKMARHLDDENIGAVTAYIKEGSLPGNYLTKFIAFEYITAQAASRRAQNVMGAMACLAGGAQLHSRKSLEAIGGRIDTSSLAEDTFTTFKTQIQGRKAIFEGNAKVWAEEPDTIVSLWKQRLRWARGNVQVTIQFKNLWFNRKEFGKLGSIPFALCWFAIFLMPILMILATISLCTLFFVDFPLSWKLFRIFWLLNLLTFLLVTLFSYLIDPETSKKSWFQGIMFPGAISLTILIYAGFPSLFEVFLTQSLRFYNLFPSELTISFIVFFMYLWLSLCMAFAYLAKYIEKFPKLKPFCPMLIYTSGYGALLCATSLASYIYEYRKVEMKWDKTEKSGKVAIQ